MEFNPLEIQADLYGMKATQPEGYDSIARLEDVPQGFDARKIRPALDEMKQYGISGIIIDASENVEAISALVHLGGNIIGAHLNLTYVGIRADQLSTSTAARIVPYIADNLEKAVESLSR